jgi:hypothetical protein
LITITVQVIEALTSPEVLGKIIPILSDKISESITDSINSSVEASIKALMDEHISLPGVSSVFSDGNSDCLWFISTSTFGLFTFVGAAIFVYIYKHISG